jgi:hypothetical protein
MNTTVRVFMARSLSLVAIALLTACSHQPKRVDCEKRLEAINAATPAGAKAPSAKAGDP